MWHFKGKMQILFPLELLSLLSANCRFLKIGLSERRKTQIAQPPKDVRKDLPVSHEKRGKRTACPITTWTQHGNKVRKTKLPPLAIFKNKNFWVALQQMLKHTRRWPEVNMSECHGSWLTPSDITGAFHSPEDHPLCLLCTDFPTIPSFHIRAYLWCEMFLPPSLWNLSQPSQSSLDTWLVKITFVELLLALLFLNNPRGWGEGLTAATQADAQERKISGSLGIVVSSSFLGYSSPLVEETFSDSGSRSETSSLSCQPQFWECCCMNTHHDMC